MRKCVLLISSVHPGNDPRIVHKIIPALSEHFDLICMLPRTERSNFQTAVTVKRLPFFTWIGWRILLTYPVIFWKSLKVKPDIIHFFVPELIPFALVYQWLGATVIYEVQENLYQKLSIKKNNNSWLFRNAFYFFDKLARKRFHFIFTEDAYLKEYSTLSNEPIVIHNFSNKGFNKSGKVESKTPSFIYSGVITWDRGLGTIIIACNILKRSVTDFQVHFFGHNRLITNEMRRIEGFETAEPHLVFHGYTDYHEVLEKGKSCLAGLAVLKNAGDYQDSYPSKIFDYMGIGIPVITSNFQLYKKIVEANECGFCIDPNDANSLAETMKLMIENRQDVNRMGDRGYHLVQTTYNWENEATRLRDYYHQVISEY